MLPELVWKLPRIAFARFVATFVLYALWVGLTAWLVSMLKAFTHPSGSLWKRVALAPLQAASVAITFVINAVSHTLTYSVSHSMPSVAHWLNGIATREIALNNALGNFATQTALSFERLVHHTIPAEIHRATVRIWHGIDALASEQIRLRHNLRAFERGIDRLLKDNVMPRVRKAERAIDVTLPRAIGRVRTRERALERTLTRPSDAWIKRIARRAWVLVLAGLMVKFLTRKFPQLFCRNTTNAAKAICGMDANLLTALLAETVLVTQPIDIREFAKALQQVEGFVADEIHSFITAD